MLKMQEMRNVETFFEIKVHKIWEQLCMNKNMVFLICYNVM
jgi:hypothetical protein